MPAIHPHLPRAMAVTLVAAVATIVVMLALPTRLGDVQLGQGEVSTAARHDIPQLTARSSTPTTPRSRAWLTNPFASLAPEPLALRWTPGDEGS